MKTNTPLFQLLSGGVKPHRIPSKTPKLPVLIGRLCPGNADLIEAAYASKDLRQLNWATAAWCTLPATTRSDARMGVDEPHGIVLKVLPKEKKQ